ncbi:MAG: hypothetical protein IPP71_02425 [Bacteroidetes bacterium]|nr:hypothetical protein [Bacteroidota bacterium]
MKAPITFGKNSVLIGILLSVVFLCLAGFKYPGGNLKNSNATGYSWTENYISHLLEYKAVNGMDNDARPWGIAGVVLMGITFGFGFARFANKIDIKKYSVVIKFLAYALILITALITLPPLHDLMVTLGSVLTLLLFFYVTVCLLKSSLQLFKFFSVLFLLCYYGAAFMYFTRTGLDYLPAVQKIIHLSQIIFILGLEYYTAKEDFRLMKN